MTGSAAPPRRCPHARTRTPTGCSRPASLRALDGAPDLLRGVRHVEMADPQWAERVDDRVGDGGRARDATGLADALDAECVDRAGRHGLVELERGQPRRP